MVALARPSPHLIERRFCRTHQYVQQTNRHTDKPRSISNNSPHLALVPRAAMQPNNDKFSNLH